MCKFFIFLVYNWYGGYSVLEIHAKKVIVQSVLLNSYPKTIGMVVKK